MSASKNQLFHAPHHTSAHQSSDGLIKMTVPFQSYNNNPSVYDPRKINAIHQ